VNVAHQAVYLGLSHGPAPGAAGEVAQDLPGHGDALGAWHGLSGDQAAVRGGQRLFHAQRPQHLDKINEQVAVAALFGVGRL
jgi:hypothetical protein